MIAIIGGGISGLASAYELARRGIPFRLLEASPRLGGLVCTEQVGGFTIEAGADSMLVQKPAALELCNELGLTNRLITMKSPRSAFVLHGGVLHPLPPASVLGIPSTWRSLASYSLVSPSSRARMALEPLLPAKKADDDESIASFFRRRLGGATVDRLAQPLLGGIHAGSVEDLSVRALFPRLVEAERTGGVLRWARRVTRARSGDGAFRSLPGGMQELVEAIRRRLPDGSVACGETVQSISRDGQTWMLHTDGVEVSARAIIFACPAFSVGQLLETVDPDVAAICAGVRYVSTASVALAWPREAVRHPLAGSGFVVVRSSNAVRITACTWVSSKWEHRAPDGHVLLRAYLGGAHDETVADLTDDEIVDRVTQELSAILSITGAPALARVHRWRRAGAQHTVGHQARVMELERLLARQHGLFVTGSGFRSVGIPDCIADGRAVAMETGTYAYAK